MKLPEPVAAQHRFRHPQKTMPNWSVWQPTAAEDRPPHEIDSMGYQVEYRNLYSEAQVKELLAERDAVLKIALDALHWTTPIGGKPVKQTQDAMDAIRKVLT